MFNADAPELSTICFHPRILGSPLVNGLGQRKAKEVDAAGAVEATAPLKSGSRLTVHL